MVLVVCSSDMVWVEVELIYLPQVLVADLSNGVVAKLRSHNQNIAPIGPLNLRSFPKLFVLFVLALGLSGCGEKGPDRSATKHFKTILSLYVDGKKREYSTVMKITYTRISKSLNGAGGSVDVSGEAIPIDHGRPCKVFMLPATKTRNGSIGSDYGTAFKNSFGINVAVGSLKKEHIEKI